jgi:hypothetical protein
MGDRLGSSLISLIVTLPIIGIALTMDCQTLAHEAHDHFSAGEPGHPQKTVRRQACSVQ